MGLVLLEVVRLRKLSFKSALFLDNVMEFDV